MVLPPPNRILIVVVDNMRLGGIQRLALDQMYEFVNKGINAILIIRNIRETFENPNFLTVESSGIQKENVKILALPHGKFKELLYYTKFFRSNNVFKIINHSVGASLSLKIAVTFSSRTTPIHTFIHQLPTLSSPVQRVKRFLYTQFSSSVHGYSSAVVSDWNLRLKKNFILRIFLGRKKISLLRNGVYLARLPEIASFTKSRTEPRLIFIGRNIGWKNLDFVFSILRHDQGKNFELCVILPGIDPEIEARAKREFGSRLTFELGKKIQDLKFYRGDVNIYPVKYGSTAYSIESISLNCLEMACIGIPSLVTTNGLETWPELVESGLIATSDWSSIEEVCSQIDTLSGVCPTKESLNELRNMISIRNNTSLILDL
jgi:hypothetical protein